MHRYFDNIGDKPGYDTYTHFKDDPAHTFIKLTTPVHHWWDYYCQGAGHVHLGTARHKSVELLIAAMELAGKAEYVFGPPDFANVEFTFRTNRREVTIGLLKDGDRVIYTRLPFGHGHFVRI